MGTHAGFPLQFSFPLPSLCSHHLIDYISSFSSAQSQTLICKSTFGKVQSRMLCCIIIKILTAPSINLREFNTSLTLHNNTLKCSEGVCSSTVFFSFLSSSGWRKINPSFIIWCSLHAAAIVVDNTAKKQQQQRPNHQTLCVSPFALRSPL